MSIVFLDDKITVTKSDAHSNGTGSIVDTSAAASHFKNANGVVGVDVKSFGKASGTNASSINNYASGSINNLKVDGSGKAEASGDNVLSQSNITGNIAGDEKDLRIKQEGTATGKGDTSASVQGTGEIADGQNSGKSDVKVVSGSTGSEMSLAHASSNQDLSSWDSILNELTGKASAEGITNSQANVQLGAGGSVNGKFWSKFYELLCKKYAQFRKDTRNWPYSFAKNQNSYCFVALKLDRKQPNTRDVTALADFSGFDITGLVSGMSEGQGGANVRTAASGHGITNGSYQGASGLLSGSSQGSGKSSLTGGQTLHSENTSLTVFGSSQVDAGNGKGDSKLTSKTNVADGDASGNIRMEGSAFGTNSNLNVSNGMNIDDSGRKTRKNVLLHFKLP